MRIPFQTKIIDNLRGIERQSQNTLTRDNVLAQFVEPGMRLKAA
jgi:hypothetical protein